MRENQTPLTRLVLFMVCLALAGLCVSGAHYYVVDMPQQQNIQAPQNSNTNSLAQKCPSCVDNCKYLPDKEKYPCLELCELIC